MVRDGYYYGAGLVFVSLVAWWLGGWPWAVTPLVMAAFFLWFFRDPERTIPRFPGVVVSPADGKVTHVMPIEVEGTSRTRISIFLNIFSVHVNRSPIAGIIEALEYRRGKFGNALSALSAEENEQNIVTVRGDAHTVIFKQIAGLLARRVVFYKKVGDRLECGERVGLIKFGSRTDVILPAEAAIQVKIGDSVHGGSSVLARLPVSVPAASIPEAEPASKSS
jgi:phosphatidylserine decarboxylase